MLTEWRKFKGWLVLEYFLKNPTDRIHIKHLSRILKISPRTAEVYLKLYRDKGILKSERIGNILRFYLNNENPLVKSLKRTYFLMVLNGFDIERFLKENGIISFCIYGSFASGEYSEESDIDILIISPRKKIDLRELKFLEEVFDAELDIQIFTPGEWRKISKINKEFYEEVKSNYIVYGADI